MSFWSGLGKALKFGGKIGASLIPGVGPVASKVLDGISMGGDVLSNIGQHGEAIGKVGRVAGDTSGALRDERFSEDAARRDRDSLAIQRAQMGIGQGQTRDAQNLGRAQFTEGATMDRANLGISAPMARTKQAAYGDALKNVQDVNINFGAKTGSLPSFGVSGGLRPSMFGDTARQAGGELSRQALMALMTKSDVPGMPTLPDQQPLSALPELSTPQGSSALEKITGGVGLTGSILGALGPILAGIKKRGPVATINRNAQGPNASYKPRSPALLEQFD